MKAYKGFHKDMTCRDFQYEVGQEYETDRADLCKCGFHACEAPLNVWRFYPPINGNRFCEVEQSGDVKRNDEKSVSSKIKIGAEIGIPGLIKAQIEWTKNEISKAQGEQGGNGSNLAGGNGSNLAGGDLSNLAGGDWSNLAGGDRSNLAGGDWSNLAGGYRSNLAGGDRSNLAGGDRSNLAGGNGSNLAGGNGSNLAGGNGSNLAGGNGSNLAGGYRSNLAGGDGSNLAGGEGSNLAGGNGSNLAGGKSSICATRNGKARGGLHSVLVLTCWELHGTDHVPVAIKAIVVDGDKYKPDTWYTLCYGEIVEVAE